MAEDRLITRTDEIIADEAGGRILPLYGYPPVDVRMAGITVTIVWVQVVNNGVPEWAYGTVKLTASVANMGRIPQRLLKEMIEVTLSKPLLLQENGEKLQQSDGPLTIRAVITAVQPKPGRSFVDIEARAEYSLPS